MRWATMRAEHGRPLFRDRQHAGEVLARRLAEMPLAPPVVVVALPRGGVPVAAVVARALKAPLDLMLVRKISAPWQPELAVAAVVDGEEPVLVVDEEIASGTGADARYIARSEVEAWREIERRRALYLAGREPLPLQGATVILVDDGIATGTTMRAALQALRQRGAARRVVAVPVAPHETLLRLRDQAETLVCLAEPQPFGAVGAHYGEFHQVGDDEVIEALASVSRGP